MDLFIAALAVDVTRRGVCSALPHAPIQQDRGGRRRGAIRRRSATVLHRLADRLESRTFAGQHRCST
jgi:hypothetical protein